MKKICRQDGDTTAAGTAALHLSEIGFLLLLDFYSPKMQYFSQ